jgi:hypothetical protein
MSLEATMWARDQRGLGAPERLVLLNLADKVRKAQCRAWPGVETIADEENLGETTVRRALRVLERLGLIGKERPGGGYRKTTVYRLALPNYPADPAGLWDEDNPADAAENPAGSAIYPAAAAIYPAAPAPESSRTSYEPVTATSREIVTPEVLPGLRAPAGARGELAKVAHLNELIAAVNERRQPPLTREQAVQAQKLARDAVAAGWDDGLVVAALATTTAFTRGAFDFAVGQLRREIVGDARSRLTKFEQSERWR